MLRQKTEHTVSNGSEKCLSLTHSSLRRWYSNRLLFQTQIQLRRIQTSVSCVTVSGRLQGGTNPKGFDPQSAALQAEYNVPASRRNGVKLIHFLGDCYLVLGLDCFRFLFMDVSKRASSHFDGVCQLCCKRGTVRAQESDGTETSLYKQHI